jgi:hypothetical protein
MKPNEIPIAGRKTPKDWYAFRESLRFTQDPANWKKAYEEYFLTRLTTRYLKPIKILDERGSHEGEGFSILAIICSLIEFLESTIQGKNYRWRRPADDEYSSSKSLFISFLCQRRPFCTAFDPPLAEKFYVGVRCAILHEARLKDGWSLVANGPAGVIISRDELIIYRINFQAALNKFIDWYGTALQSDHALQEAFIRKFDSLCD